MLCVILMLKDYQLINLEKIDIGTKLNNPWALEFINDMNYKLNII